MYLSAVFWAEGCVPLSRCFSHLVRFSLVSRLQFNQSPCSASYCVGEREYTFLPVSRRQLRDQVPSAA